MSRKLLALDNVEQPVRPNTLPPTSDWDWHSSGGKQCLVPKASFSLKLIFLFVWLFVWHGSWVWRLAGNLRNKYCPPFTGKENGLQRDWISGPFYDWPVCKKCKIFSPKPGNVSGKLRSLVTHQVPKLIVRTAKCNWYYLSPSTVAPRKTSRCGYIISSPPYLLHLLLISPFLCFELSLDCNPVWRFRVCVIRLSVFVHSQLSCSIN